MKNKLKSLLALTLSVLIGHTWAATPVATWTDFNTLTSGNYTITKDEACTVNADGSVTLGGAGLSYAFKSGDGMYANKVITVVMDVTLPDTVGTLLTLGLATNKIQVNSTGSALTTSYDKGDVRQTGACTAERTTIAVTYSGSQGVHVYKDGDLIITDGALKWSGQNLAKLTIGACDDGDIPLAGTILHSMKIYAAKLSEADVGANWALEMEQSDYASLSWLASFDGNNSTAGWIDSWGGEAGFFYNNTPNTKGGVIAKGCHPHKGYTFNQPFTIALYANIADVDIGTAANGAALIALGQNGTAETAGEGNLVLTKTATNKVALSRSGNKLVEITDEDLATDDSYHLFVFGMDAEGNIFLSVDGNKVQSESTTTYPKQGLQIGSMYGGIGDYIQGYGMIVDEIRGYSAYLNDDVLAKLTARFPENHFLFSGSTLVYDWAGKTSGKLYTLSSPVVMSSADITSFTATVQYKNGNSRIEIAGVKLVDGEGNEFIGATNGDGASFTGGNSGNNVYTFTNNAGFSGDSYTLYATLWVNGSTGTGRITLSEGVTFNDLFTESETGSIIIPAQRLSENEGNVTIPSGFALTVQGGDSEVEIAKVLTVDGSLTTMGALNFSAANRVAAGGTLEVVSGVTTFNLAERGLNGTLKVAAGATFKNGTNDGPDWGGAPTFDIAGTLEVTGTARWSLSANTTTTLREGAVLKGAGGSGYNYAFDWFDGATINVLGDATIEGNIGGHNPGAILIFNVAEGNTLTIAGKFDGGTYSGVSSLAVSGAGALKLTNADNNYRGTTTINASATLELDGGSLGTGAVTVADGATIAGSGTIGGTLTLVAGSTVDATDGSLTVNGDVTLPGEGDVTVKVAETAEAGDTVITCANAEAVAAALTGAPEGLKYVADGTAVKLAVAKVNVTIPAAPANTKWYIGETEVSGTIAVDPNTDVTLTLKADDGYVFADGSTSTTVTVNAGETGATVETPDVTVEPVSNIVAKIGETEYATLEAACNDANEGDLVQLIADTEENCVVKEGFNGTIDLGGNTLTGRIFSKSATMTIQNGTIVRKRMGTDTSSSNGAIEIQGGSLTLEATLSVRILANDVTHLIRLRNSASCVINGGNYSITSTGTDAAMLYPSASGTTMTVNGGTFTYDTTNASMPSIANIYGTLTVNGGTFNAYGQSYLFNIDSDGGKTYVKNGLFNCSSSGRLTYNNPKPGDTYGYLEFSGGEYACNPETTRGVIAEGYASGLLEDNYYIVSKAYAVGLTVDAAKATVTGLNDVHACGSIVSFTVAANEGYNLTGVTLDGEALTADENGNYTFTMPEKDVAIVVTTESTSTFDVMINGQPVADADALKLAANSTTTMTVPETSTWTADGNVLKKDGEAYVTFADYYTVVVNGTSVTLKLNKPVIGESAEGADDAFTVTADAVTIKITNYNSDLKYGVRIAADINGLGSAAITPVEPNDGVITLEKSGDSAFYEVVVSDVEIPVAE